MELSEFLEVSTLLDYYKNLLSDKQREYLVNHFEEDLSLSEIAKNNNVSRQAVYDNIKRGIVNIPMHFSECAANMLTNSNSLDPKCKMVELKACAIKVEKME